MNQHQAKIKTENLTLIKEKLFSGKAALEESDLNYLFKQFENELNETIRERLISTDNERVKLWCEVFEVVSAGDFADSLMFTLDKEIFYRFGHFIHEEIKSDSANENVILLIHEYLNLFRTSSLLKKIYKEKKWEELVFNLISSSNYNVNVLFNQRVREYEDKPLFKLIKGNTVDKISWNEVNKNVSKYNLATSS